MFFYNEDDTEVSFEQPGESVDPYFYSTSLLLKMDSDFSDSSVYQNSVTTGGNVTVSTTESKFGGGSGYFDGATNTGISFPSADQFDLRNVDWTIEAWIKPDGDYSTYRIITAKRDNTGNIDYELYLSITTGQIKFYEQGGTIDTGVTPAANQWSHVAVVRKDGLITIYVNGEAKVSATRNVSSYSNNPLGVGNVGTLNVYPFKGHIDDVRITKGVARYTANFTPPTEPHPTTGPSEIVSDQLTFHLDSSNVSSYPGSGTTWTSLVNSSDVGTFVGDPTFNSAEADSIDLDGSGDYIAINDAALFDFSGDFTIEMAMKLDQVGQTNGATIVLSNDVLDHFQLHSTGNNMNVSIGGSIISSPAYSSNVVGRWLTFTMSRISGVIYFYDNANLIGTVNNSTNIDSSALYLGVQTPSRVPFYAHFTDGKIGSFRVYNKGLSSEEVLQNFHATKDRFGL
jgi:hypothetical protein